MGRTRKLLVIAALGLGISACSSRHDTTEYYTYRPVIRDRTVYLTKYTLRRMWIPISPEGPGWVPRNATFQIYTAELDREDSLRPTSASITIDPLPDPDFRFLVFDSQGKPGIRAPDDTKSRLRQAVGNACDGVISADRQDSRILYYQCPREGVFYRFVEPAMRPEIFRLARELTHIGDLPRFDLQFYSIADESKVFLHLDGNDFFEIDLAGAAPRRIDAFAGLMPEIAKAQMDVMVAITSTLRVAQIPTEGPEFAVQVIRAGQPAQKHVFRDDSLVVHLHTLGMQPNYIADAGMVLWQIAEPDKQRTTLLALNLQTGAFLRTSFPH